MCHSLGIGVVSPPTRIASTKKHSHRLQGRVPGNGREEVAKAIVVLTTGPIMRLVAEVVVLVGGIVVLVLMVWVVVSVGWDSVGVAVVRGTVITVLDMLLLSELEL